MSIKEGNNANIKWIGVTSVLFGVLLLANHGNEILRQSVIAPGVAIESAADCRPDELEEENLSLRECQLMVNNVQIILHLLDHHHPVHHSSVSKNFIHLFVLF